MIRGLAAIGVGAQDTLAPRSGDLLLQVSILTERPDPEARVVVAAELVAGVLTGR